jgi:hypothetical protein
MRPGFFFSLAGPDLRPLRRVMVKPKILEYEKLVSLAPLKVHSTATVT